MLARLDLFKDSITLRALQLGESGGWAMSTMDRLATAIEPGKWHKVVLEVQGQGIITQLD